MFPFLDMIFQGLSNPDMLATQMASQGFTPQMAQSQLEQGLGSLAQQAQQQMPQAPGQMPPMPMPGAAGQMQASNPAPMPAAGMPEVASNDRAGQYRNAISNIESGGDYSSIGPQHDKLGRALGKYQIMEANVGPWSKEALGREVTPQEFLGDKNIQDTIFDYKFGQYTQKYGPEGAAQAWFAGPGGVGKMDRKDSLGTSVGDYTQKFNEGMGGSTVDFARAGGAQPTPPAPVGGGITAGADTNAGALLTAGFPNAPAAPVKQSFGDKLAALGKGVAGALPKNPQEQQQQRPPSVSGPGPQVGGGFARDPKAIQELMMLMQAGTSAGQVPSLASLIAPRG